MQKQVMWDEWLTIQVVQKLLFKVIRHLIENKVRININCVVKYSH